MLGLQSLHPPLSVVSIASAVAASKAVLFRISCDHDRSKGGRKFDPGVERHFKLHAPRPHPPAAETARAQLSRHRGLPVPTAGDSGTRRARYKAVVMAVPWQPDTGRRLG